MNELTLREFLDRLASAAPTPGGGSASALAGAMSAALLAMVARLSQHKGGLDEVFARILEHAERARATLTALVAEDADAFAAVMRAMRLPRATDEEKQARQSAVQQALRVAADVPLRVASEAARVLEVAPELARTGNANAISDVAVGVLLGYAAVHGALHNVQINLAAIKDGAYVSVLRPEVDRLGRVSAALRDEAMAAVRERM